MRIAVDAMTICDADGGTGAGIEHYTWSLLFALVRLDPGHEYLFLVPPSMTEPRKRAFTEGIHNVRFLQTSRTKISFFSRHIWHALRLWMHRPDVLFAPSGQFPIGWRGRAVATIHDVLIYQHPEWFSPDQRSAFSTRVGVPLAIERARRLIPVSKFTERELHKLFPVTEEKTTVVHEGIEIPVLDQTAAPHRFPYDRDYLLFLGTREPRKNLVHAVQAFDRFLAGHPEQAELSRFIFAGARGWNSQTIEDEIDRVNHAWSHIEPHGVIQRLGKVTEEEKWVLLSRAAGLLFPSYEEGFGLPLLEAMAVGTPVITTRLGALEEVGGDVPIYVDPDDVEGMSFSIAQCLLVPEGVVTLREEGRERAKQFTWKRTAEQVLEVLEQVVNEKHG